MNSDLAAGGGDEQHEKVQSAHDGSALRCEGSWVSRYDSLSFAWSVMGVARDIGERKWDVRSILTAYRPDAKDLKSNSIISRKSETDELLQRRTSQRLIKRVTLAPGHL